jgi:putative transcriptional regulator
MSKAGKRLIDAAKEAAAIARGEREPARVFVPSDIDVKGIRLRLHLSQDDFASQFGFTINQIRDWEQGRSRPLGGVRAYLLIIERDPRSVKRLLRAQASQELERIAL